MYFELSSADKIISIIYIFKNRPVNIQVQGFSAHKHFNFMAKSLKEATLSLPDSATRQNWTELLISADVKASKQRQNKNELTYQKPTIFECC